MRPDQIALSSNNFRVCHEAVAAGIGMGFMSELDAVEQLGYHCILPANEGWCITVWQVTHVDLHRTEKVQALLACIRTHLDTAVGHGL